MPVLIDMRAVMRGLLVLIAVPMAWRTDGAPGDILSATIETNGWVLDVAIEDATSNGTYNFGLGADNTVTGSQTVTLTVTSMGFDDTATPITVQRTLYGTWALRLPYPNQAYKDQTVVAGVLTNKIVLSDYVFARDSNIVAQIGAGYYTDTTHLTNNAGTLPVVNGSVLAYQRPIANWTWPGWDRITGSNFQVRAVAFHQSAQQGRPVRLMRFIAQDAHQHRVTNDVLSMTLDRTLGDQLPFGEYVGTLPATALTEGDVITNTWQAYPWVGDTPLDSGDGKYRPPTPLYSPLFLLNDTTGQYGSTIAVVSPTGSDAAGVAVDSAGFNSNAPPTAFATVAGAASAIAATNGIVHGRNDLGGGLVYLRSGSYVWLGASKSYGPLPNCNFQVATFPGDAPATISAAISGANTLGVRVKLRNLNITTSSTVTFTGETNLWLAGCTINATAAALIYNVPIWYLTECNISQLRQGIYPYSTLNSAPALVRGNLTAVAGYAYTWCGNISLGPIPGECVATDPNSHTIPYADGAIVYNNSFCRASAALGVVYENYYRSFTNGLVFAQNLLECATNGSYQFLTISGETATNALLDNIIIWHNDILGRGCDLAYDNNGTTWVLRLFWSVKNNLMDKLDIKSDTGTDPCGLRTGDWSELNGVSYSGNFNANTTGVDATGDFNPEFIGLNSYQPTNGTGNPSTFFQFVSPASYNGVSSGAGNGNYHLQLSSPVLRLAGDWVLPFDLDGNARQLGNVSGVYVAPQAQPPLLSRLLFSSNQFVFTASNVLAGASYVVQGSTDLAIWMPLATNTASAPAWTFTDSNVSGLGSRFYRVFTP
jgi:hypothetical protein